MSDDSADLARAICEVVRELASRSSCSRLDLLDGSPVADEPLVGFADGYDSMMREFKRAVGPDHLSPLEAWQEAFPGKEPSAGLSVIAFVLPFSEAIRRSNRGRVEPSPHWVQGKAYGEAVLNDVRHGLVAWLTERGYSAVAPSRSPGFRIDRDSPRGPVSNWSERHYSYAAGLGAFGLSRGLITEKGVAMRCGSVVADVSLPPSARPPSHTAYCPFMGGGGCGDCMARCPAGAITREGKDNAVCRRYMNDVLEPVTRRYVSEEVIRRTQAGTLASLGACGLCQTGVPCEARIPPASLFQAPDSDTP